MKVDSLTGLQNEVKSQVCNLTAEVLTFCATCTSEPFDARKTPNCSYRQLITQLGVFPGKIALAEIILRLRFSKMQSIWSAIFFALFIIFWYVVAMALQSDHRHSHLNTIFLAQINKPCGGTSPSGLLDIKIFPLSPSGPLSNGKVHVGAEGFQ